MKAIAFDARQVFISGLTVVSLVAAFFERGHVQRVRRRAGKPAPVPTPPSVAQVHASQAEARKSPTRS